MAMNTLDRTARTPATPHASAGPTLATLLLEAGELTAALPQHRIAAGAGALACAVDELAQAAGVDLPTLGTTAGPVAANRGLGVLAARTAGRTVLLDAGTASRVRSLLAAL